ncbi:P-loop NTPase fold protein [Cupriavidus alkaliphilus]|uniref:Putative KAP-like P-loop ATPase n=2 Tax=Cupriavidus TaxID=106589 RepID=A0A7W4VE36_9BURK|nr:P-loop NTPase fold protein [Cupriavidus alkaliphilus]MBB3009920.1 putative KAP-like P-loop ATPase [Cupriavidus alkaliphilus]
MAYDDQMPSSLDREISTDQQDAFGHRHYAHALKSLIESRTHETPFSIGLLGGWGTGKSSVKQLYTTALADDPSKDGGFTRYQRFHCITFNAWRFGGKDQDIKRALLRHVFLELGGEEENLRDKLFRQVSTTLSIAKP